MNVSESYNLKVLYPEVAEEWHPSKNGTLTPDQITPHTSKKMWWRCRDGHEWHATVGSRTRGGSGCPYCYGRYITDDYNLQVINPGVSKQWHPVKNGSLTAAHMAPNTIKIVWWLCEKGHEWQSRVCDRNRGTRCPYCAAEKSRRPGRGATSLQEARPDLAEQWHPTKNGDLTPDKVSYGSKRKVWWL
ncbi:MAG: zinc-ribbon domain-containing protein, partial [bacterium]|nr:zinc-ribbon domain-containing protein [bacterium]